MYAKFEKCTVYIIFDIWIIPMHKTIALLP
jgi:hypothetical protein